MDWIGYQGVDAPQVIFLGQEEYDDKGPDRAIASWNGRSLSPMPEAFKTKQNRTWSSLRDLCLKVPVSFDRVGLYELLPFGRQRSSETFSTELAEECNLLAERPLLREIRGRRGSWTYTSEFIATRAKKISDQIGQIKPLAVVAYSCLWNRFILDLTGAVGEDKVICLPHPTSWDKSGSGAKNAQWAQAADRVRNLVRSHGSDSGV